MSRQVDASIVDVESESSATDGAPVLGPWSASRAGSGWKFVMGAAALVGALGVAAAFVYGASDRAGPVPGHKGKLTSELAAVSAQQSTTQVIDKTCVDGYTTIGLPLDVAREDCTLACTNEPQCSFTLFTPGPSGTPFPALAPVPSPTESTTSATKITTSSTTVTITESSTSATTTTATVTTVTITESTTSATTTPATVTTVTITESTATVTTVTITESTTSATTTTATVTTVTITESSTSATTTTATTTTAIPITHTICSGGSCRVGDHVQFSMSAPERYRRNYPFCGTVTSRPSGQRMWVRFHNSKIQALESWYETCIITQNDPATPAGPSPPGQCVLGRGDCIEQDRPGTVLAYVAKNPQQGPNELTTVATTAATQHAQQPAPAPAKIATPPITEVQCGKGCSNWDGILLGEFFGKDMQFCQGACSANSECDAYNVQVEEDCDGMPGVGTCYLYVKGCDVEDSPCWILFKKAR